MGLWNGSINKCTKCNRLLRVGFFRDHLLSDIDARNFLDAREKNLERSPRMKIGNEMVPMEMLTDDALRHVLASMVTNSEGSEKLTPSIFGQYLADLVSIPSVKFLNMLLNLDGISLLGKNRAQCFLALAPLNLFAWILASENQTLWVDPISRQKVYHNLASFLTYQYIQRFSSGDPPDTIVYNITSIVNHLVEVWRNSRDKEPSRQWYVAKEIWFQLQKDRNHPNPVAITALNDFLTDQTLSVMEFTRAIQTRLSKSEHN